MADKKRPSNTVSRREWMVEALITDPDDGKLYPNPNADGELHDLLSDIGTILTRLGGTVALIAARAQVGDDDAAFIATSYRARWEARSPTADWRPPAPEAPEDLAPDPEPVEVAPEPEPAAVG